VAVGLTGTVKITIAGSGAMGCRYGAALFAAGHDVTLLDGWAEHVAAINDGGLRVTDEAGTRVLPVRAALFPAVADPAELVIVFTKATATAAVAAASAGAIGPATLLLTLQNGLGNIEALRAHAPDERLLAGVSMYGTELVGPGHITALGTGETHFGPVSVSGVAAAESVGAALSSAGIPTRVTSDALGVIWAKVAFNCVMNTVCSIGSIPVSALALYDDFDSLAMSILTEIEAVARAEGVFVDTAAALGVMKAQFDPSASGTHLASMLQDLMNGRRTEIAQLNGAIAERAARHGLEAPANALIARLIGLLEVTWARRVSSLHPGNDGSHSGSH
jgi:2-dehydropantoate 2-reductase